MQLVPSRNLHYLVINVHAILLILCETAKVSQFVEPTCWTCQNIPRRMDTCRGLSGSRDTLGHFLGSSGAPQLPIC